MSFCSIAVLFEWQVQINELREKQLVLLYLQEFRAWSFIHRLLVLSVHALWTCLIPVNFINFFILTQFVNETLSLTNFTVWQNKGVIIAWDNICHSNFLVIVNAELETEWVTLYAPLYRLLFVISIVLVAWTYFFS